MTALRKTALVAGLFYLITFITSIPAQFILYAPVLKHPGYIVGSGAHTGVLFGGLLEVILAIAGIGSAVTLFPVVKRQNETAALGFVTARVLEAAFIVIGVLSVLSVVTLHHAGATGATAASLVTTGKSLVAIHNWAFLLGPGLIPGVNALLLGYLMYRSRLVPRLLPVLGLIGAPLLFASATAEIFGIYGQTSVWSAIATIPIFVWELSLGVWMTFKGFRPSPITAAMTAAATPPASRSVTA
jgi:hypothetical protein